MVLKIQRFGRILNIRLIRCTRWSAPGSFDQVQIRSTGFAQTNLATFLVPHRQVFPVLAGRHKRCEQHFVGDGPSRELGWRVPPVCGRSIPALNRSFSLRRNTAIRPAFVGRIGPDFRWRLFLDAELRKHPDRASLSSRLTTCAQCEGGRKRVEERCWLKAKPRLLSIRPAWHTKVQVRLNCTSNRATGGTRPLCDNIDLLLRFA